MASILKGSSHSHHRYSVAEYEAVAVSTTTDADTIVKRNGGSKEGQSSGSVASGFTSRIPNPLHLTNQLLSRLEAIPRRMIHLLVVPGSTASATHHHSATVQRVLQQEQEDGDHDDQRHYWDALKQKYSKEIKADVEILVLQRQIRSMKQQIQQQRMQRERLERKQAAQREREQIHMYQQTLKLHHALEGTERNNDNKNLREYNKAIIRAASNNNKRHNSSGLYNKLTSSRSSSSSSSSSNGGGSSGNKEVLQLETCILRSMHRTVAYQNQIDLVQQYAVILESTLKRERAVLGDDYAELAMFQMVLDGTQRALKGLYPEILLRQEGLLQKMLPQQSQTTEEVAAISTATSTNNNHNNNTTCTTTVPQQVILSPAMLRTGGKRRQRSASKCSVRSDGVSDLGESLIADSVTETESIEFYCGRRGPPVFTSVHALQQSTLQQMAGVRSF